MLDSGMTGSSRHMCFIRRLDRGRIHSSQNGVSDRSLRKATSVPTGPGFYSRSGHTPAHPVTRKRATRLEATPLTQRKWLGTTSRRTYHNLLLLPTPRSCSRPRRRTQGRKREPSLRRSPPPLALYVSNAGLFDGTCNVVGVRARWLERRFNVWWWWRVAPATAAMTFACPTSKQR
ncbi:hypothetical protein SAICODRAFT_188254 [Saitoella complicata NRRL Y-17804]|uniref:uncharacterized protein n=1 Tax=Saitoella complicata (strain BCRC 22490 / CBS 7301 / JCM 7358 / NBRC 10748 / NRRL Y-17804) TaxID=698492 RepID=UPI0008681EA2|nr:uncharacterized protein SAICODRAFT_188254 [Saitoella complicata NRRL Y-17804]ODQ49897.1 hypothetical protein SAICODRAFT_188254 [Saitoella complicata NRRL Y-17804]